jgi:hypothetical protein
VQGSSKQRLLFIALSVLGMVLILFFGWRALRAFKKFDGHRPPPFAGKLQTDVEDIEDWMTIPFISHHYGAPPDALFDALGIEPEGNFKKSLKQLNDEFYPEADGFVLATVREAVLAQGPPQAPDSPTAPLPALSPAP